MPPTRVLFPFVGDSVGGSHVSSLLLASALPRDRFEPIVAIHEDGPLVAYLDAHGIAAVRAPRVPYVAGGALVRAWRRRAAARTLGDFAASHGADIVHTNDMRMHMTWGPAARSAGTAHVWHQRTIARASKHGSAAARADAVLAVSEFSRSTFPPAMRTTASVLYDPFVVPQQPDRGAAREAIGVETGLPPGSRYVAFVGNFAAQKRPRRFVALADALIRQGRDTLHFLMIGSPRGPEAEAVRTAIADAGLAARCHVLGARHPIDPWLAGADLLVAPAVDEAFGRVLVEAQLLGTPVLASDAGGHREIVAHDETGVLVDPDDQSGFARAAAALLDDSAEAARLAAAARWSAERRFSLDEHVDRIVAVYDSVVSRR